jgi:hypothetical protein
MTATSGDQHVLGIEDLEAHLRRQVGFLRRSAAAYDAGEVDEAFRLAATARLLCHRTAGSHSLLHQLGLLPDRLRFVDTSLKVGLPPGAFTVGAGLARMRMDFDAGTVTAVPPLDDLDDERTRRPQEFDLWWNTAFLTNESPLRGQRAAFDYSRRQVVLHMANKDGGAHVDPALPGQYRALTEHDGGLAFVVNGRQATISRYTIATAWMRQIAHELQRTLERDFRTQAILDGRPSGLTQV